MSRTLIAVLASAMFLSFSALAQDVGESNTPRSAAGGRGDLHLQPLRQLAPNTAQDSRPGQVLQQARQQTFQQPQQSQATNPADDARQDADRSLLQDAPRIDRLRPTPAEISEYRRATRTRTYSPYLRSYRVRSPAALEDYPYGGGAWDGYARSLGEAYNSGRLDERYDARRLANQADMAARKQRLESSHASALHVGIEQLREGRFEAAIVTLTLASELDNGDPACRVHLAQARLALHHFAEAGAALRRALQLQSKLIYLDLGFERDLPAAALQDARAALRLAAEKASADVDTRFLRAYLEFQLGNLADAHHAFTALAHAMPQDTTVAAFVRISKPAAR